MYLRGRSLVQGSTTGQVLWSDVGLSFWGGIDPGTGMIVDQHHPLNGQCIRGRILAIPSSRGSCTGSAIMLELLIRNHGPAALVFKTVDEILSLGVMVAETLFHLSIPVLVLSIPDFESLKFWKNARLEDGYMGDTEFSITRDTRGSLSPTVPSALRLSSRDKAILSGSQGLAAKSAMEILMRFAELQGASSFLDVSQAHIDACIYTGPGSLEFGQRLLHMNAKFAVPTTLNSISIDRRRWREIGMDPLVSVEAEKLADAYMAMGARMSFTCAPYLLDTSPQKGENIGWGESNAVVFANSVLAARTQKYPDFLEVCIALTGRAPSAGCHLDKNRIPTLLIDVVRFADIDDLFFPLVGYLVGSLSGPQIPLVRGLEDTRPSTSDLKGFGAAFATTSSASMFHILGITPEASAAQFYNLNLPSVVISSSNLLETYEKLNTASSPTIGLISLGNPHFSLSEFSTLTSLISSLQPSSSKHPSVNLTITTNRTIYTQPASAGYIPVLESFGAHIITDTCWCMLNEPIIPIGTRNLMTNSAKYAHYAPGLVKRGVHLASLRDCIEAACTGRAKEKPPAWLVP